MAKVKKEIKLIKRVFYCKHIDCLGFEIELKDYEKTLPAPYVSDGVKLVKTQDTTKESTPFKYCPECGTLYLKEIPS